MSSELNTSAARGVCLKAGEAGTPGEVGRVTPCAPSGMLEPLRRRARSDAPYPPRVFRRLVVNLTHTESHLVQGGRWGAPECVATLAATRARLGRAADQSAATPQPGMAGASRKGAFPSSFDITS